MAIILCVVAGLLPILITPGLLFYFDVTPKILVLLFATVAVLVFFGRELFRSCKNSVFASIVGLQCFALLLSAALSTHRALSFSGTNWRRFGLVTQLCLLAFVLFSTVALARADTVVWLLRTVSITGSLIAIYAIFQYFGVDPFLPVASYHVGEGIYRIVRPPGTLGHANYLGSYLLFVLFAGLAAYSKDNLRLFRVFGICAAALSGLALILAGSRSCWLGMLVGLVFLIFRWKISRGRAVLLFGGGLLIAAMAFYFSPAGDRLRARVHWIREDASGGARPLLWRDAVRMTGERWLAGYGPETFGTEFPRYQSVALTQQYPDFYHESPHNIFLDAFAEQGVFGFAGLAAISAFGVFLAWKRREMMFTGAAMLAMLVSLQFSAFTLATAFFFYLAIAMLVASAERPVASPEEPSISALWASRTAGMALALLFVWFGVRLGVAEYELSKVERAADRGRIDDGIVAYQRVLDWKPLGVSYDLYYSRRMREFSSKEKNPLLAAKAGHAAMIAAVRAAGNPEERQNSLYHLATLFAAQDDATNTEKALRATIDAAPKWFKPHWTLARLLFLAGRRVEAADEAAVALQLDGGKHGEVSQTLQDVQKQGK